MTCSYNALTLGTRVGVGTGTTGAQRTDVNLQTQVGSWVNPSSDGVWTSAAGTVQFAGSVLLAAGGNVTEAGAMIDFKDTGGTVRQVLLFHDVFAQVVIAAGKYAHVAYTLTF